MPYFFSMDAGGVSFGLWNNHITNNINEVRVILIGEIEGMHVVGEADTQLLELFTCEKNIAGKDKAYLNMQSAQKKNLYQNYIIKWLSNHFIIVPAHELNKIITNA